MQCIINKCCSDRLVIVYGIAHTVISQLTTVCHHIHDITSHQLTSEEGEQRTGSSSESDTKRWGQYWRAHKCRHGSSGGVTLLDTLLDMGLDVRARLRGDECQERMRRRVRRRERLFKHVHSEHGSTGLPSISLLCTNCTKTQLKERNVA